MPEESYGQFLSVVIIAVIASWSGHERLSVEWVKVAQSCLTLCDPVEYSPWNSLGQNTGVGSLSFFKGIFPTQESIGPRSHTLQADSLPSEPQGKLRGTLQIKIQDVWDGFISHQKKPLSTNRLMFSQKKHNLLKKTLKKTKTFFTWGFLFIRMLYTESNFSFHSSFFFCFSPSWVHIKIIRYRVLIYARNFHIYTIQLKLYINHMK